MSFDAIGQHGRIQTSREANIREFGLDLGQDMPRAVNGKSSHIDLSKTPSSRVFVYLLALFPGTFFPSSVAFGNLMPHFLPAQASS